MREEPKYPPAFPHVSPNFDNNWDQNPQRDGMTLRDYFAGQAVAGLCANSNINPEIYIDIEAYKLADAMLKTRLK